MSIFVYVSIKVIAMVNIKPLHAIRTLSNYGTLNNFLYIQMTRWGGGILGIGIRLILPIKWYLRSSILYTKYQCF